MNWTEEDEKRMDIIGTNGNEGLHYQQKKKLVDDPSDYSKPSLARFIEWSNSVRENGKF